VARSLSIRRLNARSITVLDVVWRIQLYGGFRRFDTGAYHASAALQIAFLVRASVQHVGAHSPGT
jgi:hypothetical protein